jgi:hypothetical protein
VTLAGATLPDEGTNRGAVSFSSVDGAISSSAIPASGAGSYAVTLLPGTYDIGFVGNPELCAGDAASHVPCNSKVLYPATVLNADGVINLDLSAVTISGAVTLNGGAFPTYTEERGALRFENDESSAVTHSLGTSGAAGYQITLFPGAYSVHYEPDAVGCITEPAAPVPCNGGRLLPPQAFTASGVLDVNVPRIQVSGAITVNNLPVSDHVLDRGQLNFALLDGGNSATKSFGTTGAVGYSVSVLPGTYSVQLAANPALCGTGNVPQIPCVSGTLFAGASLNADGVLDIDIPSRSITGSVTLLGAMLPTETQSRGAIAFTRLDLAGPVAGSAGDLMASGAAAYGIAIMPGYYVISHIANPALCGVGLTAQVPCGSQIIFGCE